MKSMILLLALVPPMILGNTENCGNCWEQCFVPPNGASDDYQMAHREIREIMMSYRHLRIANNIDGTAFIFDSTESVAQVICLK